MSEAAITSPYRPLAGVAPAPRPPAAALPQSAWLPWAAVVAPAAGILVYSGATLATSRAHWVEFTVLTVAASLAQLGSVQLSRNRVFHPAIVFVLAGVMLLSAQQLALMCLVQHIGEWLRKHYAWYIQPFNIANYVLSAASAWLLLNGLLEARAPMAAAGSAAACAFIVVNRLLLLVMLRVAREMRPAETGLLRADDISLELVLALMGVPLALLVPSGAGAAALTLAPLVLIYLAQKSAEQLEQASATIGDQNRRLAETAELVINRSTAALEALSATVDARDAYTAGHSRRVREIAVALATQLSLDRQEVEVVSQAALLHDIGKIAIPDNVLLKEGPLDRNEWVLMRSHPDEGARIIERLGYLAEVVPAIRHHHERIDGRGYPGGLCGDEIPLAARIIHVADALDAMLTRRIYRNSLAIDEAIAELRRGAGSDFCPVCIGALEAALRSGCLDAVLGNHGGAR
jgi:putative nucleotidyltransferase with HDIG domain